MANIFLRNVMPRSEVQGFKSEAGFVATRRSEHSRSAGRP